jgi:hypothetical protein
MVTSFPATWVVKTVVDGTVCHDVSVTGAGVIVFPTFTTWVAVFVTSTSASWIVWTMVVVPFIVVVTVTGSGVIVVPMSTVEVLLMIVVWGAAVVVVYIVSFNVETLVVKTVTVLRGMELDVVLEVVLVMLIGAQSEGRDAATNGVAYTNVLLIQVVAAKNVPSSNWTASLGQSLVANDARLVVQAPGPEFPASPKRTPAVRGSVLVHWSQPAALIIEPR